MESIETWNVHPVAEASFAEKLVARRNDALAGALLRAVTASALAYGFGLSTSLGAPGVERLGQAVTIAAVPLGFATFYAPSLWVLLTLFDRTIDASTVATAAVRTVGVVGLVLGGLVPAVAFFELTGGIESRTFSSFLELVALSVAGILGLRCFVRDVQAALPEAEAKGTASFLIVGVALLGLVLGARFYPTAISDLHGGARHAHQQHQHRTH